VELTFNTWNTRKKGCQDGTHEQFSCVFHPNCENGVGCDNLCWVQYNGTHEQFINTLIKQKTIKVIVWFTLLETTVKRVSMKCWLGSADSRCFSMLLDSLITSSSAQLKGNGVRRCGASKPAVLPGSRRFWHSFLRIAAVRDARWLNWD